MIKNLTIFGSGLLFALGLGVAGMTQADKVIHFLTLDASWDPSLAFVMVGGIGMHLLLYKLILRRKSPVFANAFGIPTRTDIDLRLIGGSALFGVGWALGGLCPGPGLVSAAGGLTAALVFVGTLVAGMALFHVADTLFAEWREHQLDETAETEPSIEPEVVDFAPSSK